MALSILGTREKQLTDAEFRESYGIPPGIAIYEATVDSRLRDSALSTAKSAIAGITGCYLVRIPKSSPIYTEIPASDRDKPGICHVMAISKSNPGLGAKRYRIELHKVMLKLIRRGNLEGPNDDSDGVGEIDRSLYESGPETAEKGSRNDLYELKQCALAEICGTVLGRVTRACDKCRMEFEPNEVGGRFVKSVMGKRSKDVDFGSTIGEQLPAFLNGVDIKKEGLSVAILLVLLKANKPLTSQEIADELGYQKPTVHVALTNSRSALNRIIDVNAHELVKVDGKFSLRPKEVEVDESRDIVE